jgi:hypothetical protein
MSKADSYASKIVLFVFGVVMFALALTLQRCSKDEIPETLYPDITQTIQIQK